MKKTISMVSKEIYKKYRKLESISVKEGYLFEEVIILDKFTRKKELWEFNGIHFYVKKDDVYINKDESDFVFAVSYAIRGGYNA